MLKDLFAPSLTLEDSEAAFVWPPIGNMTNLIPEQPILLYPSLAERLGCEAAVLFSLYAEFTRHHGFKDPAGQPFVLMSRQEWQNLAAFWTEDHLAELTSHLVSAGVVDAEFKADGSLSVVLLPGAGAKVKSESEPPPQQRLAARAPIDVGAQSVNNQPAGTHTTAHQQRGPAPSFGGSTGWNRPKDDLESFFEQQEERHQQLHLISLDWMPSQTTYQVLSKHGIPADFLDALVDEFVSYWSARDRKEVSWDPQFIRLAKKEWVKEQSRQARNHQNSNTGANGDGQQLVGAQGERHQSNHRAEKRERITAAVMDIKNIDW